jgi:hypothetical protein
MSDYRKKDGDWKIATNGNGTTPTVEAQLAVLMDIRDELKQLNRTCNEQATINRCLHAIARNMAKPARKKAS